MLDYLLSSFLVYQYWLLFGVLLVASVGFPTPATALLLAGGAFYAQGYLDLEYLILSGFIGCIIGDIVGYTISYRYGKDIFRRIGLGKVLDSRPFHSFEPFFIRQSVLSVFITRFLVTGLGPSVNILAGITKMHPVKFIVTDIIGEIIYIILGISIGYSFALEWESILEIIQSFSTMLASLSLISIIVYLYIRMQHKKSSI